MFYSTQILARKGPLGLVWMAAHLDRGLKRSQVHETSIPSTVDALLAPEAPLALRLSGQLLLGVCRIYSRKVAYLLQDCESALVKVRLAFRPEQLAILKKATAGARGRRGGGTAADADAPVHTLPLETITLPDDLDELEILTGDDIDLPLMEPGAALEAMMAELQQQDAAVATGGRRRRQSMGVSLATALADSGLQNAYSLGLLLAPSAHFSGGAGAGAGVDMEMEMEVFEDADAAFEFDLEEVEIERLRAAPASEASRGARTGAAGLADLLGGKGAASGGAGGSGSAAATTGSPSSGLLGSASHERESLGRRRSTAAAVTATLGVKGAAAGGAAARLAAGELQLPDLGLDGGGDLDMNFEMDLGTSEELPGDGEGEGAAQTPLASGVRRPAAPSALRTGAGSRAISFTADEFRAAAAAMTAAAASGGDPYDIQPEYDEAVDAAAAGDGEHAPLEAGAANLHAEADGGNEEGDGDNVDATGAQQHKDKRRCAAAAASEGAQDAAAGDAQPSAGQANQDGAAVGDFGNDAMEVDDDGAVAAVATASGSRGGAPSAAAGGSQDASGQRGSQQRSGATAALSQASGGGSGSAAGAALAPTPSAGGPSTSVARSGLIAAGSGAAVSGGGGTAAAAAASDAHEDAAMKTPSPPRRMATRRSAAAAAAAAASVAVPVAAEDGQVAPAAEEKPPLQPAKAGPGRPKAAGARRDGPKAGVPARRRATTATGRRHVTIDPKGCTIPTSSLREWLQDRSDILDPTRLPGAAAVVGDGGGAAAAAGLQHPKRRRLAGPGAAAAPVLGPLHSAEPAALGGWPLSAAAGSSALAAAAVRQAAAGQSHPLAARRPGSAAAALAPPLQALFRVAVGQMAPQYALHLGAAAANAAGPIGGDGHFRQAAGAGAGSAASALGSLGSLRPALHAAMPGLGRAGAGTPATAAGPAAAPPPQPSASLHGRGSGLGAGGFNAPPGTPSVHRSGRGASAHGTAPQEHLMGDGEVEQNGDVVVGAAGVTPARSHRSAGSLRTGSARADWRGFGDDAAVEAAVSGGNGGLAAASGGAGAEEGVSGASRQGSMSSGHHRSLSAGRRPYMAPVAEEDVEGWEADAELGPVGGDGAAAVSGMTFGRTDSGKENRGGPSDGGLGGKLATPHRNSLLHAGAALLASPLRQPLAPQQQQQQQLPMMRSQLPNVFGTTRSGGRDSAAHGAAAGNGSAPLQQQQQSGRRMYNSPGGNEAGADAIDVDGAKVLKEQEDPQQQQQLRTHRGRRSAAGGFDPDQPRDDAMDLDPNYQYDNLDQDQDFYQDLPQGSPYGTAGGAASADAGATPARSRPLQQHPQLQSRAFDHAAPAGTPHGDVDGGDGPRSEGLGLGSMLRRNQRPHWATDGPDSRSGGGGRDGSLSQGAQGPDNGAFTAGRGDSGSGGPGRASAGTRGLTPFRSPWTNGPASMPGTAGRLGSAGGASSAWGYGSGSGSEWSGDGGDALLPRSLMELDAVARAAAASALAAAAAAPGGSQQPLGSAAAAVPTQLMVDEHLPLGLDLLRRPFGGCCPQLPHSQADTAVAAKLDGPVPQMQPTQLRWEEGQMLQQGGGGDGTQQRAQPETQEAAGPLPTQLRPDGAGGSVGGSQVPLPPWSDVLYFGSTGNGDAGGAADGSQAGCVAGAARLSELTRGRRRRDAARCFYDMLVLKCHGLVELKQATAPPPLPTCRAAEPSQQSEGAPTAAQRTAATGDGSQGPAEGGAVAAAAATAGLGEGAVLDVWVTLTQRGVEAASVRLLPAEALAIGMGMEPAGSQ